MGEVKVLLRNPRREVEVAGPVGVQALLRQLALRREAVLVIVDGTLVTGDTMIAEGSEVEIRPVVSGGALGPGVLGPGALGPEALGPDEGSEAPRGRTPAGQGGTE